MCGITGFNWKDEKLIKKLTDSLKYRGPDDGGTLIDNSVSLGHRRLSIIDLSRKGKQPMSFLGYTITFNGEIYNYKDIKEELAEYDFKTGTDTEAIIYAYDKWGAECLKRFNGMFAFGIYDSKKKELFLARDRFGIKPLYYMHKEGRFAFASEMKVVLPLIDKREVDPVGLSQFFSYRFTLHETTLVKGIKKFLPSHFMLYDLKRKKIKKYKRYYALKKQEQSGESYRFHVGKLKEKMAESVERRMVADVPVACLLSGGVDSSVITLLAKKHNSKLNTFSIGFDTTNELPFAKIASKHIKTNHHEYKIGKDDVLKYLDDMVFHMDEPIGDPGFLPIFVLSKEISKHNKVVLSGDGGDEVFCGYDRYKLLHYGSKAKHLAAHDFGNDVLKRLRKLKGKEGYDAFFEVVRLFDDDELNKLQIKSYDGRKIWKDKYDEVTNAQEFDINTLLPGDFFMKADKMSSAFGLEQRVPFMDHELVEFAFSLPLKHKLRLWNEKRILKDAFKADIPSEIAKRRKHGFDVPIDYWFKNVLGERLKQLLDKREHNLYDKKYVYELLNKIKEKGDNYKMNFLLAQKLWSILMFEMWYERFMR